MSEDAGAQPDPGQGAAPYADYLNQIPEELRAQVEPVFKEWDGNVTKKFQEASEFRGRMEPFAPLVDGRTAEEIEWGLQFRDAALNSPAAIKEWYEGFAKENNLFDEPATPDLAEDLADPDITQALDSKLGPIAEQVQALAQRFEQQDQQARLAEAQQMIETQMSEQKEKLGTAFNQDAIEGLIGKYLESDPAHAVERAAQDWQGIFNQIQADAVQGKLNTSGPAPETGGAPNAAPEDIKSFASAKERAMEMIRANRAI